MKSSFTRPGLARFLVTCCVGIWLVGCQSAGVDQSESTQVDEKILMQRVEQRWRLKAERNLVGAYEFLSPGSKALMSVKGYQDRIKVLNWTSGKGLRASCDGNNCRVLVEVGLTDRRVGGEVRTIVEEFWIKEGGTWWFVFSG